MKVYLRTSSRKKDAIKIIQSVFEKNGHKVDVSIAKVTDKDIYASEDTPQILKYDLVVIETSDINGQLGFETAFALEKSIPVALLYNDETGERALFPLIGTIPRTKLLIKGYKIAELENDVKHIAREFEDFISSRFTISFTTPILDFLNWITDTKKIARSDYIRNLIETAMKKNTEYKKVKKG